jgi:hypothetical protein
MTNKKISDFTQQQAYLDTDQITFIRNGTNFRATLSDLLTYIGATGQLSTIGSPTGVPVLNQPTATTNEFRSFTSGKGVNVSIDSFNGISVEGNFSNAGSGVPLIVNTEADLIEFRNILAGDGINVTQSGNNVLIAVAGTPNPSTNLIITQESDFPTQDATTITLEAGISYQISGNVSTAKTFVCNDTVMFSTGSTLAAKLTYTGSGNMFSITNTRLNLHDITIDCPNGTVFNMVGDGTGNIQQRINSENVIVKSCNKFLVSDGAGAHAFNTYSIESASGSPVVSISGSNTLVHSFVRFAALGLTPSAVLFDFGSSVSNEIELADCIAIGDSTAKAISGLAASGNVSPNGVASVSGCNFSFLSSPLDNISPSDIRWSFISNSGASDSLNDSLVSTQSNASETIIASVGVPVKVVGTFVNNRSSRFTVDLSGGRMTYTGERGISLPIDYVTSVIAAAGGDKQVSSYIAINGSVIPESKVTETISSSKAGTMKNIWQHNFANGDYVEIFLSNDTNTENLIAESCVGRIN